MLTQDRLKELLHYDPDTGVWRWRVSRGRVIPGEKAGRTDANGYVGIRVERELYYAHRLAWVYMTGEWPLNQIDHINMDRADNRWCNLRAATVSQQRMNRRRQTNNRSGHKGVYWHKAAQKWVAEVNADGKKHYLGLFECPELAALVCSEHTAKYHGAFARTGE